MRASAARSKSIGTRVPVHALDDDAEAVRTLLVCVAQPRANTERRRQRQPDVVPFVVLAGIPVDHDPAGTRVPIREGHGLHVRQRVRAFGLGELAGSVGGPLGRFDLLRCRLELRGTSEPGTDGLDTVSAEDVQPVDVLARLAGQSDVDLEAATVREGERAGCLLAGLEPAVVGWLVLVPVGSNRDPARRGPGLE